MSLLTDKTVNPAAKDPETQVCCRSGMTNNRGKSERDVYNARHSFNLSRTLLVISLFVSCLAPSLIYAQAGSPSEILNQFRKKAAIQIHQTYQVPTIIELSIHDPTNIYLPILIWDETQHSAPSFVTQTNQQEVEPPYSVQIIHQGPDINRYLAVEQPYRRITGGVVPLPDITALHDHDLNTTYTLEKKIVGDELTVVDIQYDTPQTMRGVRIDFTDPLSSPVDIEIHYDLNTSSPKVAMNHTSTSDQSAQLFFPGFASSDWRIVLTYTQPLRISEMRLIPTYAQTSAARKAYFLAQVGHSYALYMGDPYSLSPSHTLVSEDPSILPRASDPVVRATHESFVDNPAYVNPDSDADGVPDTRDNCPVLANPDQTDLNQNRVGDTCDDYDHDGLLNSLDNCRDIPNSDQSDTDGDQMGDACDTVESRFTEAYPWLPWLGIITGFAVVIAVLATTRHGHTKQT